MARIAVIAGVASERKILSAQGVTTIALSGADHAGAARAVASLLAEKPDALLSFGTAGGLAPDAHPGTLVVAPAVVTAAGERFQCDTVWSGELAAKTGAVRGDVFGSDDLVSASEKGALHASTGCAAVDMESHIAACMAAAEGIPFAVLRAVADDYRTDIPRWLAACVTANGGTNIGKVLTGVLGHPYDIVKLVSVGRSHARAADALRGAAGVLGSGLGFGAR